MAKFADLVDKMEGKIIQSVALTKLGDISFHICVGTTGDVIDIVYSDPYGYTELNGERVEELE